MPSLWYNVRNIRKSRCLHDTTSTVFVRNSMPLLWYNVRIIWTSRFAVTMTQSQSQFSQLWYSVRIVCTPQYTVSMIQRQYCLFVTVCRYRVSSSHHAVLWFNVSIVLSSHLAVLMILMRRRDAVGYRTVISLGPIKTPVASLIKNT